MPSTKEQALERLALDAEHIQEILLEHNILCVEAKLLPARIRALVEPGEPVAWLVQFGSGKKLTFIQPRPNVSWSITPLYAALSAPKEG